MRFIKERQAAKKTPQKIEELKKSYNSSNLYN
jgi:hypothetical protein